MIFKWFWFLGFFLGFIGWVLIWGFIVLLGWVVLWFIVGYDFLLGGNIFGIFIVIVVVVFGGFLMRKFFKDVLLFLLGMFVVGFIFRNVLGIDVVNDIDRIWLVMLWSMVLVVILIWFGLEFDLGVLKRLKFVVICLVFFLCIGEVIIVVIVVKLLFDMFWFWGF